MRTSFANYEQHDGAAIETLTFSHVRSLGNDFYGRVTVGYLERMYGGISSEILWHPVASRLALGAEVNYVMQRDYDMGFGFRDYDVVTSFASAYYDMANGDQIQVDAGRYLAGDWGATIAVDREFRNGWSVGAFMTLTDVLAAEFGEGSFDKGIRFSIPVSWLTGQLSQSSVGTTIRPITRRGSMCPAGSMIGCGRAIWAILTISGRGYGDEEATSPWIIFMVITPRKKSLDSKAHNPIYVNYLDIHDRSMPVWPAISGIMSW